MASGDAGSAPGEMNDIEAIFEAFRDHSSPTVDPGESHGGRGLSGMIVWATSYPFIRVRLAAIIESIRGPVRNHAREWEAVRTTLAALRDVSNENLRIEPDVHDNAVQVASAMERAKFPAPTLTRHGPESIDFDWDHYLLTITGRKEVGLGPRMEGHGDAG